MLKEIDPLLSAEMLFVMRAMGHGDDLLLCDRNFPARSVATHTTHSTVISVLGSDLWPVLDAVLKHLPLDAFVERPVTEMQVVGAPDEQVQAHRRIRAVIDRVTGEATLIRSLERFAFYDEAKRAFAVVQTSDPGPYGCFLLKKGVI